MPLLEREPPMLRVPLREDPPGVWRVGDSRVLLELVLRADRAGQSPRAIVDAYDALDLGDVYAVLAHARAHPAEVEAYLERCDAEAAAVRRRIESAQPSGPTKAELIARSLARDPAP